MGSPDVPNVFLVTLRKPANHGVRGLRLRGLGVNALIPTLFALFFG